jgi:hypothetical protein
LHINEWFEKLFSTNISTKILSDERKTGNNESKISVSPENIKQSIIIGYCLVILFISLYVPWKTVVWKNIGESKILVNLSNGYSFIFSPYLSTSSIDYGLIILEIIATTVIAVILYILKDRLSVLINHIINLNRSKMERGFK